MSEVDAPRYLSCRVCGKPVEQRRKAPPKLVCRNPDRQPSGKPRTSKCERSRISKEARQASWRKFNVVHRDEIRAKRLTPESREQTKLRTLRWRDKNRDKYNEKQRLRYIRRQAKHRQTRLVEQFRKNGQALLDQVRNAIPRHYDRATRDEMIAEAVLLALEGATVADAVKAAIRQVNRIERPGRYAKPIEECFWL